MRYEEALEKYEAARGIIEGLPQWSFFEERKKWLRIRKFVASYQSRQVVKTVVGLSSDRVIEIPCALMVTSLDPLWYPTYDDGKLTYDPDPDWIGNGYHVRYNGINYERLSRIHFVLCTDELDGRVSESVIQFLDRQPDA